MRSLGSLTLVFMNFYILSWTCGSFLTILLLITTNIIRITCKAVVFLSKLGGRLKHYLVNWRSHQKCSFNGDRYNWNCSLCFWKIQFQYKTTLATIWHLSYQSFNNEGIDTALIILHPSMFVYILSLNWCFCNYYATVSLYWQSILSEFILFTDWSPCI